MHKGHFKVGTVEGTGSLIIIQLGFTPEWVRILNIDDNNSLEWTAAMPDDSGMKTVTDGTISKITSDGITPYAGTVGANALGFTIGTDSDVNVNAQTLVYVAASGES